VNRTDNFGGESTVTFDKSGTTLGKAGYRYKEFYSKLKRRSSDEKIHDLIDYARDKFGAERYPFAPALRPVREVLAKLDPKPTPEPLQLVEKPNTLFGVRLPPRAVSRLV